MLIEALASLLTRKEFDNISIQEIADEATLNRATLYLHYADKNALLQAMNAVRFRDLVLRRGLSFTNCDGASRAIALGVCDYLAESAGCPSQLTKMSLEGSIIPAVESMLREGLPLAKWLPESTPNYWRPRRRGPSSAPLAAGIRPPTAFPLRRWLQRLKRW
jgi:AcrR family transcriptional regulator